MCAFWKKKERLPITYGEAEMDILENFIADNFGEFEEVFHEIVSPDIHVDILIIPPAADRNFFTLVTMGMGARKMDVPRQFSIYNGGRAEIMVTLPPDWDIKSAEERYYWPLRWLKMLARLPITNDTWLGWGHTVPNGTPFADNTRLSGVLLQTPYIGDDRVACRMPDGSEVEFYHMIPLYDEEMDFKISHGTEELFVLFGQGFDHVINSGRRNYCAGTGIVN